MIENSYRSIINSLSILASSQAVNILSSVVKVKLIAAFCGPQGVGILGTYQALIQHTTAVASFGLGSIGAGEVSKSAVSKDRKILQEDIAMLFAMASLLGVIGALVFYKVSPALTSMLLPETSNEKTRLWLAVAIMFSTLTGAQISILAGLKKVRSIALVNLFSSLGGLVLTIVLLIGVGSEGLLIIALLPVLLTLVGATFWMRKHSIKLTLRLRSLMARSRVCIRWLRLGLSVVIAGATIAVIQLYTRAKLQTELGLDYVGFYQASWSIGVTYIAVITTTMGNDFFPRLAGVIFNPIEANQVLKKQIHIVIIFSAPILLFLFTFANFVLSILYTSEFESSSNLLRSIIVSDFLKIISWPLGFVLLALNKSAVFAITEIISCLIYLVMFSLSIPSLGIVAPGVSMILMYLIYLPLMLFYCHRYIRFSLDKELLIYIFSILCCFIIITLAINSKFGLSLLHVTGILVAVCFYSFLRIRKLIAAN